MKCLVCLATVPDVAGAGTCPQCGYDHAAADARDATKVHAARAAFQDKTSAYAPESRVTRWDRWRPLAAIGIALALFVFWLRACGSFGRMF
jgi:hypothetical protein